MAKPTSWKQGQSGNPEGRPPGAKDKRTALRSLLEPHAEELVAKAIELAKSGDTTALRLCLERLCPPLRAQDERVELPGFPATFKNGGEYPYLLSGFSNDDLRAVADLEPPDALAALGFHAWEHCIGWVPRTDVADVAIIDEASMIGGSSAGSQTNQETIANMAAGRRRVP